MAFSKTLIPLLLLFLFVVLTNMVASQTTDVQYDYFSPDSEDLIYQGDAFLPPSSSSIRLTKVDASGNPVGYSVGRVVYSRPVKFWDTGLEATFQTTIKFSITSVNKEPGDGLTFFIIPVDSPIPNSSTGGNFGLFNSTGTAPSVFAVEFDIYYASNAWDPKYPHIGIDINSRDSKVVSKFEDSLGEIVTARINYEESSRTISVDAEYGSKTVTLSHVFDLKTILPKEVQFGISASTGASFALHDLHYWRFTSTLIHRLVKSDRTTPPPPAYINIA